MLLENQRLIGGSVKEELSFFKIEGPDASHYLENQTPNIIPSSVGEGYPNVFVTNKGGFISAFYLYKKSNEIYWAVVKTKDKESFIERLELYHISEDFEVSEFQENYQIVVGEKNILEKYKNEIPYWYYGNRSKIIFNEEKVNEIDGTALRLFCGFHEKINRKLFTDTRYIDFCYDKGKGCFPGQETIAKIVNNRGAALFPCLLKGDLVTNGSLIKGEYIASVDCYHLVLLSREHRVNHSKIELSDGSEREVLTFPFLEESKTDWVVTLCDKAHDKFHEGQLDEAKILLRYVINVMPDYADAYEMLGVILGREDKFQEAITLMQKLSDIDPSSIMAHTNLSLYYMKVGEIEKAEDEKTKAMLKEFENSGNVVDTQEEIKRKNSELERKESMYKQVLEIDSEDFIAVFGLGEVSFSRGEYAESLTFLERAKGLNPKHSQTYLLLGKTELALKNSDKAKEVFEQGIKIAAAQGDMMPANEMQSLLNTL